MILQLLYYCIQSNFLLCISLFNILTLKLYSHYVPVKVISKRDVDIVSHTHLLQVISEKAAILVSHSHLLFFFGADNFTLLCTLALIFTLHTPSLTGFEVLHQTLPDQHLSALCCF